MAKDLVDIKDIILKKIRQKGSVRAGDMIKETGYSRQYINRFFQDLREEGKILLVGKGVSSRYITADKDKYWQEKNNILSYRTELVNKGLQEDLVLDNIKSSTGIFTGLRPNVSSILDYAFTEILNNAIDHSKSEKIQISIKREDGVINFEIKDRGIGIFRNIKSKYKLKDIDESIELLLKGKSTTAPAKHSGEGIYFTSKAVSTMIINSYGKKLIFNNIIDDIFIINEKEYKGTSVKYSVPEKSKVNLKEIFNKYSDEDYSFNKTEVRIDLSKRKGTYISRSEAKRILFGLEKFKIVILNFKGIETVGQGFADEVFRVWQNKHPKIELVVENSNENIDFMINRARGN